MSHNIHYVVVKVDSAKGAISTVEREIEDWGTDNNWRTILGTISKKGEFCSNESSYHFTLENTSIKDINKSFDERLQRPNWGWGMSDEDWIKIKQTMTDIMATDLDPTKLKEFLLQEKWTNIYMLIGFVKTLDHISWTLRSMKKRRSFDLFKDEYASWILDEYGVTHLSFEGNNTYCVVVDMHS